MPGTPRPRRTTALLLALTILAALLLFADLRAREADKGAQPALETAEDVIGGVRALREELNRDLAAMRARTPGAHSLFRNNHRDRIMKLSAFEGRAGALQAGDPEIAKMRALLIRYAGLQMSMELTLRSCYESLLFSVGAPMENSCYGTALDLLAHDAADMGADIASLRKKLEGESWFAKAVAGPGRTGAPQPEPRRAPGIILVLVDTLRADALGAYGARTGETPFLDRLAREGVVFESVTAPSAVTHISIASLFSGADPYEANAEAFSQWNSGISLIKNFHDAGFFTIGFSANSIISSENKFETGFDFFRDRFWPPAPVMVNEVRSHVQAFGLPRPFFLYLQLIDPHDPYFSPDTVPDLARNGRPAGMIADPNFIHINYAEKGLDARNAVKPENAAYLKALYMQEVAFTDRWLGHLFEILDAEGYLDNTLVIITADHGEQFLEHGHVKHTSMLFQELVHVPMIMWGALPPGLEAGSRVPEPHSLMELLPSLLAWQGAPPKGAAGRRTTLFSGRESAAPIASVTWGARFDLSKLDAELIAMRRGNMKFIFDAVHDEFRLFDLASDPGERNDLSESMPARASAFRDEALALRKSSRAASKRHGGASKSSRSLKHHLKTLGYMH
jgi:arylsulfatase A-like enzyme